jgi:WD40 repeat protein
LASGKLRLSLTGHISSVRALKISSRHPYLFSGGEDKQVKCWDLEQNKVVRHYHGHLSAVQDLALHPVLDLLVTSARDSTARVWDMRTKAQVFCLSGHTNTVAAVLCQENDPQVITGSHDSTIRLWDLAAGKSVCTLTNHKVCFPNTFFNLLLFSEKHPLLGSSSSSIYVCIWIHRQHQAMASSTRHLLSKSDWTQFDDQLDGHKRRRCFGFWR